MAESELDKHTSLVTDLTRKIDELQVKADEAERLKDQVDERVLSPFIISASLTEIIGTDTQRINCRKPKT